MNEKRTGNCLRQVEHIRDQPSHGGDRKTFEEMTSN